MKRNSTRILTGSGLIIDSTTLAGSEKNSFKWFQFSKLIFFKNIKFAISNHCFRKSVMRTANWEKHGPFLPAPWKAFWPSQHLANFRDSMIESKAYYEEHNERVIRTVPKDRLLIWNVKDGWEPLCKFLGKEVPNIPIPVSLLFTNT